MRRIGGQLKTKPLGANWNRVWLVLTVFLFSSWSLCAEQRFPPPDFESGYQLPVTAMPAARSLVLEYTDVAVLSLFLAVASYLVLKRRSRPAVLGLSVASLAYFGFYRKGCICAIGATQNVVLSLCDSTYALPLTALAFFTLPLVVSLFCGRSFCAAVCPHGALQDLVLIKPVAVPAWLEQALGLIPYFYLGGAVALAAAGSAFVICRYDPFVPLFRLNGSAPLVIAGIALLGIGTVVGRPYCRFLCPYGALLKLGAKVAKWPVAITPDTCTLCRLCEQACPYGAIEQPCAPLSTAQAWNSDRRRLGWALAIAPLLILAGATFGSALGPAAARVNPTVALAERYIEQQKHPAPLHVQTAAALSLARAAQEPQELLTQALRIQARFRTAARWFGAWVGLVLGAKLIGLSLRQRRAIYQPDAGACFGCARCFAYCPSERSRRGWAPGSAVLSGESATPQGTVAMAGEGSATTQSLASA